MHQWLRMHCTPVVFQRSDLLQWGIPLCCMLWAAYDKLSTPTTCSGFLAGWEDGRVTCMTLLGAAEKLLHSDCHFAGFSCVSGEQAAIVGRNR
jgi:hypothetical protein